MAATIEVNKVYSKDEQHDIIFSSLVFILLFSLDKEPRGKRLRKKIIRGIKKYLAIMREKDKYIYNSMIINTRDLPQEIVSLMTIGTITEPIMVITPSVLIKIIGIKKPDLLKAWGVDSSLVNDYCKCYEGVEYLLYTYMYFNRSILCIDKKINK